jgi:hypothetical protein
MLLGVDDMTKRGQTVVIARVIAKREMRERKSRNEREKGGCFPFSLHYLFSLTYISSLDSRI